MCCLDFCKTITKSRAELTPLRVSRYRSNLIQSSVENCSRLLTNHICNALLLKQCHSPVSCTICYVLWRPSLTTDRAISSFYFLSIKYWLPATRKLYCFLCKFYSILFPGSFVKYRIWKRLALINCFSCQRLVPSRCG